MRAVEVATRARGLTKRFASRSALEDVDLGAWQVVSPLFDRERLLTHYGGA